MAKKYKVLIIAALIVLLICATVFMLFSLGVFTPKIDRDESKTQTEKRVSEISRTWHISYTDENGRDIELIRKKEGSTYYWTLKGDESFPLSTDKVNKIASSFMGLTIKKEITGVTDISVYGLDNPALTVTMGDLENEEITQKLTFGKLTGKDYKGTELIYLMINDDKSTVYEVENLILPKLTGGLYSLAAQADIPKLSVGDILKVTVTGDCETVLEAKTEVKQVTDENGNKKKTRVSVWYLNGESAENMKTVSKLKEELTSLELKDAVYHSENEEELKKFGLTSPVDVKIEYESGDEINELKLSFFETPDGCYAMTEDNAGVYKLEKSKIEAILIIGGCGLN